jgi:hypothetical protein
MVQIKTLADFKRALKVGQVINCTLHKLLGYDEDKNPIIKDYVYPPRKVSIVQSNSVAFKTINASGEPTDSWLQYPKATECEIIDNTCIVYHQDSINNQPRRKVLTYSFPENEPAGGRTIQSFPTIDLCVDHLVSIGCQWDNEKEEKLKKGAAYVFENTIVFYDPHNILAA